MGLFNRISKLEPRVALVEGDSSFSFKDFVGESNYRQALRVLIAEGTEQERETGEVFRDALIVPEPTNTFDKNAIQVRIAEHFVGYIAKTRISEFHPVIQEAKKQGFDYVVVKAVIGFDSRSADPLVGVRLDLTEV